MMVDGKINSTLPRVAANSPDYAQEVAVRGRQQLPAGGKVSPPQPGSDVVRRQLNEAAELISELVDNLNLDSELEFKIDDATGESIVTVLDGETGEIIRSFPSEESLAILRYIAEFRNIPRVGFLMDHVES